MISNECIYNESNKSTKMLYLCCTYVVPKQKKPLKNEGLLTAKLQSLSTGGETRTLTPCGTRS